MSIQPSSPRYHSASIALHWLMLALFVAVYASMELRVLFEKGTVPRELMKNLHYTFGFLIFFLVWLRIAIRLRYPAPRLDPAPPEWQELAAKAVHLMLYVLMIGMPLAGWLMLSAAGKPIALAGFELMPLIGKNKELAGQIKEVHEFVGNAGYFLIGAHAAAALFHHYIKRDSTLRKMLPKAAA